MRLRLVLCVLLVFATAHAAAADVVISGRRETKTTIDRNIATLLDAMPWLMGGLGSVLVSLGLSDGKEVANTVKDLTVDRTPTVERFTISMTRDRMHMRSSDNKGFSGEMTIRLVDGRAQYHLVDHGQKLSARFDVERGVATNFRGLQGASRGLEVGIVGLPNLSSVVMRPTGETKQMLGAEARRYYGEVLPRVLDFSDMFGLPANSNAVELYSGYTAEAWVASPDAGMAGMDEVQSFIEEQAVSLFGGGATPLALSMALDAGRGMPLDTAEELLFYLDIRYTMVEAPSIVISTTTTITSVEVTEVPDSMFDDAAPADYTPMTPPGFPGSGGTGGGDSGVAAAGPGGAGGGGAAGAAAAGPPSAGTAGAPPPAGQSTPPPCDCSCAGFKAFQELSKSADRNDPKAEAPMMAAVQCARQCMMRWVACAQP